MQGDYIGRVFAAGFQAERSERRGSRRAFIFIESERLFYDDRNGRDRARGFGRRKNLVIIGIQLRVIK